MKIEKVMPSVMAILIITLLALATSCTTTGKLAVNQDSYYKFCPGCN
jgi:hypothetical protein